MKVEPNFDGTEATDPNPAAAAGADPVDPDALIMDPVKSDVDLEEGEEPQPQPLRVRYTGTANHRILSRQDLSGQSGEEPSTLQWSPGAEISWERWVELAGSDERARMVLGQHAHEFELVGDGADEFELGVVEYSVGGVVAE
jgi:hypothetical protein